MKLVSRIPWHDEDEMLLHAELAMVNGREASPVGDKARPLTRAVQCSASPSEISIFEKTWSSDGQLKSWSSCVHRACCYLFLFLHFGSEWKVMTWHDANSESCSCSGIQKQRWQTKNRQKQSEDFESSIRIRLVLFRLDEAANSKFGGCDEEMRICPRVASRNEMFVMCPVLSCRLLFCHSIHVPCALFVFIDF